MHSPLNLRERGETQHDKFHTIRWQLSLLLRIMYLSLRERHWSNSKMSEQSGSKIGKRWIAGSEGSPSWRSQVFNLISSSWKFLQYLLVVLDGFDPHYQPKFTDWKQRRGWISATSKIWNFLGALRIKPGAAVWEAQMLTLCYAYPKIVDILPTPSFKNWRVNVLVFVLPFPDNATRVVMTAAPL